MFWALLLNSKHLGVPEDSKSPTLEVLGFTPTLGQSGVATPNVHNTRSKKVVYVNVYFLILGPIFKGILVILKMDG